MYEDHIDTIHLELIGSKLVNFTCRTEHSLVGHQIVHQSKGNYDTLSSTAGLISLSSLYGDICHDRDSNRAGGGIE